MMIEMKNPNISISRQCELLALNRSSLYYKRKEKISSYDLHLMRLINERPHQSLGYNTPCEVYYGL